MPFPTHLLTDDEELVLDLRPHWWFLAPVGSVLALVTIGAVAALVAQWWAPLEWAVLAVWIGTLANGLHEPHHFMTENDRQPRWRGPAFDLVQFGMANAAGMDANEQFVRPCHWNR